MLGSAPAELVVDAELPAVVIARADLSGGCSMRGRKTWKLKSLSCSLAVQTRTISSTKLQFSKFGELKSCVSARGELERLRLV
jgi:hypothetical protein